MDARTSPLGRDIADEDTGLSDLRQAALVRTLGLLLGTAFALLILDGISIGQVGVGPAYVALALAAVVALAYRCRGFGTPVAAEVLTAGLIGVIALAVVVVPGTPSIAFLGVPVLIATVLLGTSAGAAALLIGGAGLTYVGSDVTGLPLGQVVLLTYGLGGLVLVAAVTLWTSFYTVLDWSWTSYVEAQEKTAALRERQVELGRLNQSLVLAYDQIKQTSAQLERARQAAELARRLKAEFAASVSHELRTPLNMIIGLSEIMVDASPADGPKLPDLYQADVEAIYRNACHISNLIDDVLDLSQIEAHHMGLLKEWTALPDIVAQATATVRTLFENTALSLEVRLPEDLPLLFVDPVRIRQILINLLNNAVRFTEEGGVVISARVDGDQIVIEVRDTGVGIPPQELAGVFHEFWRSGEPKRGRRGSGLGLAVSQRFAELHGGNMWVTSSLGHGSTFALALPYQNKAIVQETDLTIARWQRLEQQTPAKPAVLLVDPEPEVVRAFGRYLDGYQVGIVENGRSVARMVEDGEVKAIIVGTPTCRDAVRRALDHSDAVKRGLRLPIVNCSLRTSRTFAQEIGVRDYLVKPVTRQQLRRAVRRFGRGVNDFVVVDDDPEMLRLLTRILGTLVPRCCVRTAIDGAHALDLIRAHRPQGIFLDLMMPGVDGYAVLAYLRQDRQLADVPVVAITARGTEDDGLVAESLEISQVGGLHLGELCRWLQAGLGGPRSPTGSGADSGPRVTPIE